MKVDHPILSALCIYAAENGPLKITKEQVLAFSGDNWGAFRLTEDDNGDFTITIERVSPEHAHAIQAGDAEFPRVMRPDEPFFGPSNMMGPLPHVSEQTDHAEMDKPRRRGKGRRGLQDGAFVAEPARNAIHVATVVLTGGPHDGQRVVVPLPLKRIIFPATKPGHPEVADFQRGHAYLQRRVSDDPNIAKSSPYYDYAGFKSREQIKEEFSRDGEEFDSADYWKDA